jgi:hypothetical protein
LVFVVSRHPNIFPRVEYRIGCHSAQRVEPGERVGYPDLVVKVTLLRYVDRAF